MRKAAPTLAAKPGWHGGSFAHTQTAESLLPQFSELAQTLARRIAYCQADVDDLYQEGMIALYRALCRTPEPNKPFAFAKTVLTRYMRRYYSNRRYVTKEVPLDELKPIAVHSQVQQDLVLSSYYDEVQQGLGLTARWVAENLVEHGEAVGDFILSQDDEPEQPDHTQTENWLRQQCVRKAIGYNFPRWYHLLSDLRQFTQCWLERHRASEPIIRKV